MKKPPIAKPVGIPIRTDSGRLSVVRVNDDMVFMENLKRAWLICKKKAADENIKDWEVGLAFYMALAELFEEDKKKS